MKALSLWEPWATAIAVEGKRLETRSWPAPEWIIGERIAIHAAQNRPPARTHPPGGAAYVRQWIRDAYDDPAHHRWMRRAHLLRGEHPDGNTAADATVALPRGVIICTVVVASSVKITDVFSHRLSDVEYDMGDYTPGRYAWQLKDVRRLREPVACKGGQKLFNVPEDVEQQIKQQEEAHEHQ